ncbi:MAG TPA: anthranilate phosphoribosyltransferase, partial [Thermodesulfovibrionales bacterium]|nr:anthranilate phosphoribosyltransferase [Thermodesulfovibrionales bacterium]
MAHTFNISTAAAVVTAAAGVPVAKHGNRSVSSRSGSADVLEALGVRIDLPPDKVERSLYETGFGFLFAPLFHPAMKYAVGARKEISIRTIFNILGPLTNPAGARRQILGVFADRLTEALASVLGNLGAEDIMVVHGEDGLDEITISDGTRISRWKEGKADTFYITPEDFGFHRADVQSLAGGDKFENARILRSLFNGEKGPRRDVVLMNSAAALLIAGRGRDFGEALHIASEVIDSGRAAHKLQEVIKVTNEL